MSKRGLVLLWPMLLPRLRSHEPKLAPEVVWDQEAEKFRNTSTIPTESPREKIERLMPVGHDIKRLIL